jgi:hypothetical protein
MSAVCIRCGTIKNHPQRRCAHCQFKPATDSERARSLVVSTDLEMDNVSRGLDAAEIKIVAEKIRLGTYVYDEKLLAEVMAYAQKIRAISLRIRILDGCKWLIPPLVFLLLFYGLRHLK